MKLLKIPVQLVKRLSDGAIGEMRWQIEVPEQFIKQATALEAEKGKFFILMGSFEEEQEIEKMLK